MMCQKTKFPFKIEGNVLIGDEEEIENNCPSVAELLLNAFKTKPDFIGQVDALTGKQNTFRQMRERSVKCALWLKKQGVKPGDIVVTSTHNHLDTYIPFLASLYIGAITSPWNENSSIKNVERALELTTPKVIFINSKNAIQVYRQVLLSRVPVKIVVFDELKLFGEERDLAIKFDTLDSILGGKFDETEITGFSCVASSMMDTVLIMYSSGSTGVPKAVEIPQAMLITPATIQSFSLIPGDVVLWFGSLSWITCVIVTICSILSHATAIKFTGFDSEKICWTIEKYKVTWMLIETGVCHQLVKSAAITKYNISSLRQVLFTGSMVKRDLHEDISKFLPDVTSTGYGMTEAGVVCYQMGAKKIGSSGHVCKNIRLIIVDVHSKKLLGPNAHGEIYVKCPHIMNGYYKDPETTKNVFNEDGWFCTGDLGYYDEDGYIFIVNRIKNLIKYRGHHVASADIESLLDSHPAVRESAVIGVSHRFDGQHPIAFVSRLSGVEVTEEELKELIAMNMEDQNKLRGGLVFIANIPRLVNGKVDRLALYELVKKE